MWAWPFAGLLSSCLTGTQALAGHSINTVLGAVEGAALQDVCRPDLVVAVAVSVRLPWTEAHRARGSRSLLRACTYVKRSPPDTCSITTFTYMPCRNTSLTRTM